jgi:virulence-associated protein VapD
MNSTKRPGLAVVAGAGHNNQWPTEPIREGERMYAICFDLEVEALKRHYINPSYGNGYEDIRRVLEQFGFSRQQGSVYFGGKGVDPVRCVVAVQALQKEHPWFAKCVRDIRMLRIEENNNLMPALGQQELGLDTFAEGRK